MSPPSVLVLMGVSGCGKSTTGALLAGRLGWPFRDADSFHPPANIEKMSRGTPLTDEDRAPWLAAIAAWIDERLAAGAQGIVSCSALKRAYRDAIVAGRAGVRLVYLKGEKALIAKRMAARLDHFMPPALLDSQFAALEEPGADESPLVAPVAAQPGEVVEFILKELGLGPGASASPRLRGEGFAARPRSEPEGRR
ncbi:MAG TPA: gluconokinase [Beijerinckiaceae bacterium]|jgi:carbohydrate kinase (thermoresistant glucokinase family)|nr:gntK [Microvirga sp.]HZB38633.1 gluconokinase [Beijerinckiaceae bacterium]